jgi:hypothetical protein
VVIEPALEYNYIFVIYSSKDRIVLSLENGFNILKMGSDKKERRLVDSVGSLSSWVLVCQKYKRG